VASGFQPLKPGKVASVLPLFESKKSKTSPDPLVHLKKQVYLTTHYARALSDRGQCLVHHCEPRFSMIRVPVLDKQLDPVDSDTIAG
jgi:hypothetical protein